MTFKRKSKAGVCVSGPPIKLLDIRPEGDVNKMVYGYDWEGICEHCGKKFKDHK
jgi:hypothetical protein